MAEANALHSLRFSHLGTIDGLPSAAVLNVYQDRQGLIWIGTIAGLARFDGRHFKVFQSQADRSDSLSHPIVHALLEDQPGRLWVGTAAGLDRLDSSSEQIQRQQMPANLSAAERRVVGLLQAGPGKLWMGCYGGLFLFDIASGRFERSAAEQQFATATPGNLRTLLPDGQGGVWVARGSRVLQLRADGSTGMQFDTATQAHGAEPAELMVSRMALDGAGRLWVGMTGGLQIWRMERDGPRPDPLGDRLGLPKTYVYGLLRDREGSMWIGQSQAPALHRWREGALTAEAIRHLPAIQSSLVADSVSTLALDATGSLWVGSWDYGISVAGLGSEGFSAYVSVPGDAESLSGREVMAIAPDGAEHVWAGTYGQGLNRLHLASGHTQRIPQTQLPITQIKALLRASDGRLWVGGERGLVLFDPSKGQSTRIELGNKTVGGASISALAYDAQGDVWASSKVGVYRIGADLKARNYLIDLQPTGKSYSDIVDSLLLDRQGRLWVGSKGGLYLWDAQAERFGSVLRPSALMPNPSRLAVHGMRQDALGRFWLATDQGLFELLDPDGRRELKSWRELPGMPTKGSIESLEVAGNGEVWFATEHGLVRVQPEQRVARYYDGPRRFDGGFNFGAAWRAADGHLFFGGHGLLRFNPELLRDNLSAPEVVLSDLLILNRSLRSDAEAAPDITRQANRPASDAQLSLQSLGITGALHRAKSVHIGHRESMISFELSALHFSDRNQNQYAWMLEGFDTNWIFGQGALGLATYTNLDPGSYRLLVKAANSDGVWGEGEALLTLEVQPPYWRTWWWRTGLGLLVLMALAAFYHWRVRFLQRTRQSLARQVTARTQELQEQKLQLAAEKQQAEAQREQADKARHDIAVLSEIGRQITASLDVLSIQRTLYAHAQELVNASVFGVGLLDREEEVLAFDFVMHHDQLLKPYRRSLSATEQPAVQCVLGARDICIDDMDFDNREIIESPGAAPKRVELHSGAELIPSRSCIYAPMMLKGEVIGVVCALSDKPSAFGAGDLDILRTLGAYAAVAFDNAEAYRRLQLTQARLVEHEKLAALGSLVAGVAHELNTPLGNSLLVASTLRDTSKALGQQVQAGGLRRSDLLQFCEDAESSSDLLMRSLGQAAGLVSSFKQLAVDRTSDQRRSFELHTLCDEVALTLANRLRRDEHELVLDVEPDLRMDSYPGPLGQVLSNLILNAMLHGLDGRKQGRMRLQARRREDAGGEGPGEWVRIEFSDNGSGISAENLGRIFEPFFTTRLGQGGSGLGLHISYNIVTAILGGHIEASSPPGEGARFVIDIPCTAP
ncbi:two-component regulator propeller domain-containing protein [Paucibacter sp. AS339]|uniref:two-component regulator propeller domain-containing protein n=1 Tax=Paucibacter hankyongi TaxID=3133434 RepID=UPI00309769CC